MSGSRSPIDFYVGYRTDNSKAQGRFTRRATLVLLVGSLGVGALLALLQTPFDAGIFEFGQVREVEGLLRVEPQPALVLTAPISLPPAASANGMENSVNELLLVELGKHGASDLDALAGRTVRARGTLIAREAVAMLELAEPPEALGTARQSLRSAVPTDQQVELTGEIVDSKCFLGVMKPGRGKVHRACATLCLEGGIPPAFLVRNEDGEEWVALLLDENGEAPRRPLAPWVGEAVTLSGSVHARQDAITEFHVDLDGQLP